MKKQLVTLALLISGAVSGCAPHFGAGSTTTMVSGAAIVASAKPTAQKSEEIAQSAEALLSAEDLGPANEMVDLALEQDSSNLRARFLHALLAPLILERGMAKRLRPFAEKDPDLLMRLDQQLARTASDPNVSAFLLDGNADITTEKDVQDHLDGLAKALDDLRIFLKGITDQELTLHVPDAFLRAFTSRYAHACQIKVNAAFEYELTCPPASSRHEVTLNQADFQLLSDSVTYYLIQIYMGNGFDLSGLEAKAANQRRHPEMNGADLYRALLTDSSFGLARQSGGLTKIRGLGLDAIAGLQWAMANQATLCPNGSASASDRPGMLFNQGICVPSSYFAPVINLYAKGLTGKAVPVTFTSGDQQVLKTEVDWTAIVDRPLPDVRSLGTIQFDTSGNLISVTDSTAGGMFPRGDVNTVLSAKNAGVSMP